MKNTNFDLIDQSYYFPQKGFDLHNGFLTFYRISLQYLVDKYNTPFKLLYLPRIGEQIKKARNLFNRAIKKVVYKGKYQYCYCTKCCHFSSVVETALNEAVHTETSSCFDIDLIYELFAEENFDFEVVGHIPICIVPMIYNDLEFTSDSTTSYGSYSGAVLNEKITWGKLDIDIPKFIVVSEASIVAPLNFAYLLD